VTPLRCASNLPPCPAMHNSKARAGAAVFVAALGTKERCPAAAQIPLTDPLVARSGTDLNAPDQIHVTMAGAAPTPPAVHACAASLEKRQPPAFLAHACLRLGLARPLLGFM
jgi:hypothetical protein